MMLINEKLAFSITFESYFFKEKSGNAEGALQKKVGTSAAHILTKTKKFSHITPVLKSLVHIIIIYFIGTVHVNEW